MIQINSTRKKNKNDFYICEDCSKEFYSFRRKSRKYPNKCRSCSHKVHTFKAVKHGARSKRARPKLYTSWVGMRDRCLTKTNKDYKEGIGIDESWSEFEVYKEWALSNNYIEGETQIRRINPKKGYGPDNCIVIVRKNLKYEYKGKMLFAYEIYNIAGKLPISKAIFNKRLRRGWSINKAMMEPLRYNQFAYKRKTPN